MNIRIKVDQLDNGKFTAQYKCKCGWFWDLYEYVVVRYTYDDFIKEFDTAEEAFETALKTAKQEK